MNGQGTVEGGELELDRDACVAILTDLVREKGKTAFSSSCQISDGMGSGVASVYQFAGYFWIDDEEFGMAGPYEGIEDAIVSSPACCWLHIDGELDISSTQLSAAAIAELLHVEQVPDEVPFQFTINRQRWELTPDGEVRRVRCRRRE